MKTPYRIVFAAFLLSITACSTFNRSVLLGGALGATAVASAVSAGEHSAGITPKSNDITSAALVGLGLGVITASIIQNANSQDDESKQSGPKMYFGDLPPSPFVFPRSQN